MATVAIILMLDSDILADFYAANGAVAEDGLSEEQTAEYLKIAYLEPFVHQNLLDQGNVARRERVKVEVRERVSEEEKVLTKRLHDHVEQRRKDLPRPTKPPVVEVATKRK